MTDDNMTIFHKIYEEWIEEGKNTPMLLQGTLNFMSHWTFQSIVRMDNSERAFKTFCTLAFSSFFYRKGRSLKTAFALGHSLNFVLNSHVIATFKTFNLSYYNDPEKFERYSTELLDKLSSYEWVESVYVTGSVNRDEWKSTSDLDVDIVRKPGIHNGVLAVFYALFTRFSATLHLFPIDMYVWDSETTLENRRISDDEDLVDYKQLNNLFD